eukprot:gene19079-24905_t
MLVYLSKRIAIPNQVKLNCITWNRDQGWIATGGDSGLLKVLKLETPTGPDAKIMGIAAPSNLSMNQTLEGHNGRVICATWNPVFKKLTTSDENGLIIVWVLIKGVWYEEMINNRNKSVVKDMKWTVDGRKICIIYEDGAVIVGSVDGNRLWGKDLGMSLRFVEWSPDGKFILFVTADAEVWVYDNSGNKLRQMSLAAVESSVSEELVVVGIQWFALPAGKQSSVSSSDSCPSLFVAFDNGMILLSRGEVDKHQIVFDSELKLTCCRWDCSGTVLAVTGTIRGRNSHDGKSSNFIKFFDAYGKFLRGIRVPGDNIASFSWEGSGLRIALAVDSSIFFANIRPNYHWAYLGNTVVYAHTRYDRKESTVIFWDLVTLEANSKVISNLKFVCAAGDLCAVVWVEVSPVSVTREDQQDGLTENKETYRVQLRNAIGAVIDSKTIPFSPKHVSICASMFIATNDRTVFTWLLPSNKDFDLTNERVQSKVRLFDIESVGLASAQSPETFKVNVDAISDRITCSAVSDKYLVIARKSGAITRFVLPHISPENTYSTKMEPFRIDLNCNSTRLSVIDISGVFSILDLEARVVNDEEKAALGPHYGMKLSIERRDVWDMKWAEDNDEMIVIVEKTKMVVIRGETPEDPIISSGYLARFKDLEIKAVSLDDLLSHPDQPTKDSVVSFDSRLLRDAREMIVSDGLVSAYHFINANPHSRLWTLLAHSALESLELDMAEKAFVRTGDYHGIQLVKQLRTMTDKMKSRAEVCVYLGRFDEAEGIYREIDRKDLAIQMRKKIGDFSRVVQLLQTGGGNDSLVKDAYDKIGEYYADRFKWKKSAQYFQQSRNLDKLADAYYRLESFDELSQLRLIVPDGTPLLMILANRFESVGMHEEAVDCYIRSGNPKAAVDCCVTLNQWETALSLAEQHDFPQVEGLLNKFASELINKGKKLEAVELFRRANRPTEAALLIGDIAENAARKDLKPSFAKKLHVLAALEIERHRKKATDNLITQTMGGGTGGNLAQATAATLETLMMSSLDTQVTGGNNKKAAKAFGNAWRGAAAYHYYMLAQKQFYNENFDASMKTCIKLCEYDDVLEPKDIYKLLCLSSLKNKFYGTCSKAFIKLETLSTLSETEREEIQSLVVKIFVKNSPVDPVVLPDVYTKCIDIGKPYKACVISGRAILDSDSYMCKSCRHPMLERERLSDGKVNGITNCPLCHNPLASSSSY